MSKGDKGARRIADSLPIDAPRLRLSQHRESMALRAKTGDLRSTRGEEGAQVSADEALERERGAQDGLARGLGRIRRLRVRRLRVHDAEDDSSKRVDALPVVARGGPGGLLPSPTSCRATRALQRHPRGEDGCKSAAAGGRGQKRLIGVAARHVFGYLPRNILLLQAVHHCRGAGSVRCPPVPDSAPTASHTQQAGPLPAADRRSHCASFPSKIVRCVGHCTADARLARLARLACWAGRHVVRGEARGGKRTPGASG